jgi:predicted transcriptional regulator
MPRKGYTSVTLPLPLVREARRLLDRPRGKRYRSLTELISEALEEKLEAAKGTSIVSTRAVSREEVRRLILDYLRDRPGAHYPSDIANSLGLDLEVVFEVTRSLLHEHIIETKHASKMEVEVP